MDKQNDNIGLLKDFLELHSISYNNARVGFDCDFDITVPTNINGVTVSCKSRITFTGNGKFEGEVIVDCDLPTAKYPTTFLAYYNDMNIEDDALIITGTHPSIGIYTAILSI
ncbi:hypothetical protein FNW52_12550 [Flavobacterium sp. ZT3R18]|uniref:hypothetical protein n=1 Tax=Flavobacterium sp. ZT3R18 TaxID=2594429 RepID=UPI00117A00FC|nr:hypothetical protein [Flavobacterium sp. ZT3R18]TRX34965.1 hypothetical protein FNW52_12550 [Flavobacterium sp. ZT3R18]